MLTRSHSNSVETPLTNEQETKMSDKEKNLTIADLMKELQEGNKKTDLKLTGMDETLKDNKKLFEDYIKINDETVNKLKDDLNEAKSDVSTLKTTVTALEGTVNELTEEIKAARQDLKLYKTTMQKLEKNDKLREDEKRRANIIIEGLKKDAKLHPRQQVGALLKDIGVTIPQENIPTVTRLGPIGGKGKKPRPILVKFSSYFYKQEVFKNISKLHKQEKWRGTFVQDDLPQEEIAQHRDLRCLSALAKEKGHASSVRGSALIINEQRYSYRDIDKLPEGISMEAAKLVQLEDGWAFQGHHAFLSTMFPCQIKHDGQDFNCSEQVYYFDMAIGAGDQRSAEAVRDCKDGYAAKRVGNRRKRSADWNDKKEGVITKAQEKKFGQNEHLRKRLVETKGTLYEATRDQEFGVGLSLAQKALIGKAQQKGKNKFGVILMNTRDHFSK